MGHSVVAYLVSLAVGYWVLTLADKQEANTKTLGKVFAWIIIVVSLLGPVCKVAGALCCHENTASCGYAERGAWGWHHRHDMGNACVDNGGCPFTGKADMKDAAPAGKMMDKEKGAKDGK
ncbi:MAG TPA: hypothetical protein VK791_08195 [bacterium]|jgi:hypothetical protein|nr:hypothetical protein [bacterium]